MFDGVDNTIPKTISHSRNFSSPMLQLLKSCLPWAELTVPATTWDDYLDGWHSGNSVLQLMIITFLEVRSQRGRWKLLWQWLASEEGNCQRWAGLQYLHLPSSPPTVCQLLRVPTLMHRRTETGRTCIPVFLLITLVDSSPRQCLLLFFCGDSRILYANSKLGLFLFLLVFLVFLVMVRASMTYCDGWTILLTSESKRSLGCYRHSSLDG